VATTNGAGAAAAEPVSKPEIIAKSWRDVLPVHPAADLFPLMSRDELIALAEDIEKNGLQQRVIITPAGDGRFCVLDGRNRLDALEYLGRKILNAKGELKDPAWVALFDDDGAAFNYVIGANIHRRHLTAEQRRDLIANVLKAKPELSDRAIAK
jgi:hypothetical protein